MMEAAFLVVLHRLLWTLIIVHLKDSEPSSTKSGYSSSTISSRGLHYLCREAMVNKSTDK